MASDVIEWVSHARRKARSAIDPDGGVSDSTFELAKSRRPSRGPSVLPENALRQRGATYERADRVDGPLI